MEVSIFLTNIKIFTPDITFKMYGMNLNLNFLFVINFLSIKLISLVVTSDQIFFFKNI